MFKAILSTTTIFFLWGASTVAAQGKQVSANGLKTDVKFLEDITVAVAKPEAVSAPGTTSWKADYLAGGKKTARPTEGEIENADKLQFKFSILLDMEVEALQNLTLLRLLDEWLGTRYRLGGNSKAGIDCSAFMQVLFSSLYNFTLPRTAREQFAASLQISRTELREGDLVFFNTTGGISHVGMYLQNNKFVHASSSGVTISDLFDDYWSKRFIGVGRLEGAQFSTPKP
jgi:lipoprotein Spr